MTSITKLESTQEDLLVSHQEGRKAELENLSNLYETLRLEAVEITDKLKEILASKKSWLAKKANLNSRFLGLLEKSKDIPTCNVKVLGYQSELVIVMNSLEQIIERMKPLDDDSDLGAITADLSSLKEQIDNETKKLETLESNINEIEKNLLLLLKLRANYENPEMLSALEKQIFIGGSLESFTALDIVRWGTGLTEDVAREALRLLSSKKCGIIEDYHFDSSDIGESV